MSSHESPVNELDNPPKRRIQRRHGACEPCRSSKTKCDGRTPCGACRSERRRQCPCVYSEKAMKLQQVTAEIRRRAESERRNCDDGSRPLSDDDAKRYRADDCREHVARTWADEVTELPAIQPSDDHMVSNPEVERASMSHSLSVCAAVEEFKRLKPARGYSAQVVSRCSGFDVSTHSDKFQQRRDSTLPHLLISSPQTPTVRDASTIQILEARLGAVDSWIKEGDLDRAWTDLASLVREAQILQEQVDGQKPAISSIWRNLWHRILDLESQVGLTTGRPTTLVLPKQPRIKTKNDTLSLEDSLDETRMDLYQHIQGVLALDINDTRAIRDFLERADDILHHEPFTQIGLCTTTGHSAAVRDLHLNTHLLFMIMHCRIATLCDAFSKDLTNASWSDTPAAEIIRAMNLDQPRQKLAYCRRMFRSATFILDSFVTLHQNDAEQTGRNWLRCHSAYTAALVLGIAKLRHEVEWHATTDKLTRLELIFSKLSKTHQHCYLFSAAVARLNDLNSVKEPASEAARTKHNSTKIRNKRSATSSVQTSPKMAHQRDLNSASFSSVSPTAAIKRSIDMVDDPAADNSSFRERSVREDDDYQAHEADTSFEDINLDPLSFFQDNSATYSQSNSSFTSNSTSTSATSFSDSEMPIHALTDMGLNHPGPPFAYPFPYTVFHPPMSWNNPPYIMPTQNGGPLALQIPLEPQYSSGNPAISIEAGSQYGIHNSSAVQASSINSHHSSPLQPPSEGTVTSMRLSPASQNATGFQNVVTAAQGTGDHDSDAKAFLQQVKTPLLANGLSNCSDRPSLDTKNSSNTNHHSSLPTQKNLEPSPIGWHPTSVVATSHEVEPQLANTNGNAPETVNRPNASDNRNRPLPNQNHPACYPHPSIQHPTSHMLGAQFLTPEQMAYMNTSGGIFEANQYHGQYQHGHHLPPFNNSYIASTGPIPEQWRRMSIGAGGDPSPSY